MNYGDQEQDAGCSCRVSRGSLSKFPGSARLIWSLALGFSLVAATAAAGTDTNHPPVSSPAALDPLCTPSGPALDFVWPSTRKMAALLNHITRSSDPRTNIYLNHQRADLFRAQVLSATNEAQAMRMRMHVATELLNAGETRQAIDELTTVEQFHRQDPAVLGLGFWRELRRSLAIAQLRLGEQENCLAEHNPESCLFPIQTAGVHRRQRGSREAIEILREQLAETPGDLSARWLLNVASMTIGEYPAQVPAPWLIGPEVFRSEYDIKRFPEVARALGLDILGYAGGTVIEDFDGDGNLDILMSDWSPQGPLHYFRNNGDGTFTDRTIEAGLAGLFGGLNLIQGDYNNDGLPDVLVLRGAWLLEAGHQPDSLLRNDGNGHFTDVTEAAGLLAFHPNQTAVWFDFGGDGWLDIYFGYESSGHDVHPCELYRNNHDGTFTECAAAAGVAAVGYVKAVVSGDFNRDGRPDLYLSRRGQPNILFRNDGPARPEDGPGRVWRFTDVSEEAGVTEPIASFPAWFFDYDNDGWDDIFVGGFYARDVGDVAADYLGQRNQGECPRLYHNNHNGTFTDVTKAMHLNHVTLAMGANFGDFDNDGWLDIFLGTGSPDLAMLTPDRAFRNAGGKCFQDVTTSGGFGNIQKGHGVSFGDLDNDGDQDILHCVGGAYEGDFYRKSLFENPGHGNHWITLKLEGHQSNRVAIGARIRVVLNDASGERSIYRTVGTGGSFGANPLRQEIGLGHASAVERVEIFWPVTGKTQVLANLPMDGFYRVREGEDHAIRWDLRTFHFATTIGHSEHPARH